MPPKAAEATAFGWLKSSLAHYKGKIGKLTDVPAKDGWVTIEYADGSEDKKAKVGEMKPAAQEEWDDAKRKAHAWDDKNWIWGTFVKTNAGATEIVVGQPKPRKLAKGKVGKVKDTPNRNGEVKLEWPDGSYSGLVSIYVLKRVTEKDWIAGCTEEGLDHTVQGALSRKAAKGVPKGVEQLGARPPVGDDGPMILTTEQDMKIAFEMLDAKHEGALSRGKSREWLRAMGYCLVDEELDSMLDVHGPPRSTSHGGKQKDRSKWSLAMLTSVAMENQSRDNSSVQALADALRRLAGSKGKISKDKLLEFTKQEQDLTQTNFEDVLASIGMNATTQLDCDLLARKLINRICKPPTILQAENQAADD